MTLKNERDPIHLPRLPVGKRWELCLVNAAIQATGAGPDEVARWAQRPEVSRRLPAEFRADVCGDGQG